MSITGKILAQGQLPSSKGTLYTVPGGTKAFVRFLRCNNIAITTETVTIYYNKAASRRIGRAILAQDEAWDVMEEDVLVLDAGDLIEGESTNASAVDYVIAGAEE